MQRIETKKIFFLLSTFNKLGGAERVVLNILKNINLTNFQCFLITFDKDSSDKKKHELPKKVKLIRLNVNHTREGIFKCISLINKEQPNTIFCGSIILNIIIGLLKPLFFSQTRTIARETSIPSENNKSTFKAYLLSSLYRFSYMNHDIIICPGDAIKKDLISNYGIKEEKLKKINNPVDFDNIFSSTNIPQDRIVKSKKIKIISGGGLRAIKGFHTLIESIYLLNNKNIELFIFGGEAEKGYLESLKKQVIKNNLSNQITFLGHQHNPYKFMQNADIFAFPSIYDGFPNILIESICLGLKVAATPSIGGLNEIIEGHNNIFIAEDHQPKSLAVAIDKAIKTKIQPVNTEVLKKFELKPIVSKYEEVL